VTKRRSDNTFSIKFCGVELSGIETCGRSVSATVRPLWMSAPPRPVAKMEPGGYIFGVTHTNNHVTRFDPGAVYRTVTTLGPSYLDN
jgi:hypothetical protein